MMLRRRGTSGMRVVGYIRVSTEDQNLGPDAQRAALEKWCAGQNAQLLACHEDLGISGGVELDKRPALLAALDSLRLLKADVLLVAKRDRLARDVMVSAMVERLAEKAGARVMAADGTGNGDGPEAQLMRSIVDAFAQYERALIRARTRAALAVKKARSQRVGEVPYGYQLAADRVHIEPLDAEQHVLGLIREMRGAGLTIRAIAERLNITATPARGARWHARTVHRVLQRNEQPSGAAHG